jgi:hypothetical protein
LVAQDSDDEAERWKDLAATGPSIGRPLLERLLISMIDGHQSFDGANLPHHARRDRERRLKPAMKALFNLEGPKRQLPDHAALLWIAKQQLHDRMRDLRSPQTNRGSNESGPKNQGRGSRRSERQLAREASAKFFPKLVDVSESLRTKWAEQKSFWLDMARSHDDVVESIETQALAKIWVALSEAGVSVVPNWPDGRQMSEEQMLRTGFRDLLRLVELRRNDRSNET